MAIVAQLVAAWDGSGRAQLASAWAEEAESGIQIHDDFERCSINAALSSVGVSDFATDEGETVPLITMRQRLQVCTSMGANARWMEPYGKITGVLGLRPRVEIVPFGDGSNHQTWSAAQRGHYSYDGLTWYPIATKTYSTRLSFRHDQPFEQDTVYIARSWPRPLSVIGSQIEAIASAHPEKVFPTPSALSFTPVNTTGFPAQAFIAGECAPKTDELGRTVPHTPLYAFEINDSSYTGPKKDAHIIAGIHSGEDLGEILFWEMIDFLLNSTDPAAVTVRENFRVFVYPCANPPGRYAGYWRGSPGTDLDPNRYFTATTPPVEMDYIPLCRSVVLADHAGRRVYWAWNIHASPSGEIVQVGPKEESPGSIAWDAYARARHPTGSWGDYYDRTQPYSADLPGTVTQWQRIAFTPSPVVQMLFETCDRVTPVSPALMRPYAEASIGALADMDAAGWFDEAPAGTLTLGTASVTSSSISLPWTYSAADHDGIEYRYRLTAGTWSAWIDAGLVSPIEITGLISSAEYEIEARAYNSAGAGTPQTVTVTVGAEIDLSGAALSTATSAGTLTTAIPLSGAAASLSAASGDITAQITLSGAALAQAAATAALTAGAADLAGDAVALAAALGTLTVQIRLAGDAVAQSLAAAELSTESAGLSGAAQASATAMGLLGTAIPLAGEATATASASGALGVPVLLSGAAAAVSSATGELTIALALEGHSLATALASGTLTTAIPLSGAAIAQALASGALAGAALLTPASRTWRVRYPVRLMRVRT